MAFFLACGKYPPYDSDMIPGPEPGSYDAFLENRRIGKQLRIPLESVGCRVTLVIAGAWTAVCGWMLRTGERKRVFMARWLVVVGCATAATGALVFPVIVARGTSARNACINFLRQIDGAKEQWALENKKTLTDTPTWRDLIGRDKYLKTMPECPGGGRFMINSMSTKPTCSIPDHTLQ